MDGLKSAVEGVAKELAEAERNRDLALAESRKIIRLSKNVIHAIHVGSGYDGPKKEMEDRMHSLVWNVSEDMLLHGPAADAMMEFAEAGILSDVVAGAKVRTPEELGITPQAWVMGLADTIGEIRRVIVGCLMNGDTDRAKAPFRGHGGDLRGTADDGRPRCNRPSEKEAGHRQRDNGQDPLGYAQLNGPLRLIFS